MNMRMSPGGDLVVAALHEAGITHTFGIPGTHNIELYDALNRSPHVSAILVTDEQSASFMADGMARSGGPIACANLVPGAGLTHALSGIGEAYLDNIPMLVLVCGVRGDTGRAYQLHDVDQLAIVKPLSKAVYRVEHGEELRSTILEAVTVARSGCPGPVVVEVPCEHYLFRQPSIEPQALRVAPVAPHATLTQIRAARDLLLGSKQPLIHVGLGAVAAQAELVELAERLGAVVSSTFSGKGVFPETHPQWLWPGFGRSCPKPLQRIVKSCDSALIIGARLGEVSTGSYGITLPDRTIHVDIDANVLGANFPIELGIQADARDFLTALLASLDDQPFAQSNSIQHKLRAAHNKVSRATKRSLSKRRVSPPSLFSKLQEIFPATTCYATDSGKGTFLAMEHLRLTRPGRFMAPTDYSCMGYSVPAAIGAAFADPSRPVVALPGDGALLMTGLELLTAVQHSLPVAVFVLNDGELGQISRFQKRITKTTPCTSLTPYNLEAFAAVFGIPYLRIDCDIELEPVIRQAHEQLTDGPVVVDVRIDYSRLTDFTRGVLETNLRRLPLRDRARFIGRVVTRTLV